MSNLQDNPKEPACEVCKKPTKYLYEDIVGGRLKIVCDECKSFQHQKYRGHRVNRSR